MYIIYLAKITIYIINLAVLTIYIIYLAILAAESGYIHSRSYPSA